MPLIAFRRAKLDKTNLSRLVKVNQIIESYREMGYTLTLRQLYYRLVTENVIANTTKDYARLIHLLTEGRMSGMVDWDGIEDRVRVPSRAYFNHNVEDAISDAVGRFRLDRQKGQPNYVELWVEKDAISNILKVKTHHYGIYLMVNRGFSSTTAMYNSAVRIKNAIDNGQTPHILYLGDHDPSGLCMALRDIPERLQDDFGVNVNVKHIGITSEQIKKYAPPPNPAKLTDSRAQWYIKHFGKTSWEVDALEPKVLHELIEEELRKLIDIPMFDALVAQESGCKDELRAMPTFKEEVVSLKSEVSTLSEDISDKAKELEFVTENMNAAIDQVHDTNLRLTEVNNELVVVSGDLDTMTQNNVRNEAIITDIKRRVIALDLNIKDKESLEEYTARVHKEINALKTFV